MIDVVNSKYASWLEDTLRAIVELQPAKIGVVMLTDDGTAYTAYWGNCGPWEKGNLAFHLQADAIKDLIVVNFDSIAQAAAELAADEESEEKEDAE